MIAIPAIDLSAGRAVRLLRGEQSARTDYGDPVDFALRWRDEGAERIHVVNLDGAFDGKGEGNLEVVARIVQAVRTPAGFPIPVEVGGGLRDEASVARLFEVAGAAYAVLGTLALRDPAATKRICARWPDRVYLGLDVKDGRARGAGWTDAGVPWKSALASWRGLGARGVIATAVARDGALAGPDLEFLSDVRAAAGDLRVIASGGVGTLVDLADLRLRGPFEGVILGKALYESRFTLAEARAALAG